MNTTMVVLEIEMMFINSKTENYETDNAINNVVR